MQSCASGICVNGNRHGGDGFPSSSVPITWRDEVPSRRALPAPSASHPTTSAHIMLLQMTIGSVTIRFSHKFPDPTPAADAAADKKVERHKEGRQQFVDDFVSGVYAPTSYAAFASRYIQKAVVFTLSRSSMRSDLRFICSLIRYQRRLQQGDAGGGRRRRRRGRSSSSDSDRGRRHRDRSREEGRHREREREGRRSRSRSRGRDGEDRDRRRDRDREQGGGGRREEGQGTGREREGEQDRRWRRDEGHDGGSRARDHGRHSVVERGADGRSRSAERHARL
jgi:hypothetical protein